MEERTAELREGMVDVWGRKGAVVSVVRFNSDELVKGLVAFVGEAGAPLGEEDSEELVVSAAVIAPPALDTPPGY